MSPGDDIQSAICNRKGTYNQTISFEINYKKSSETKCAGIE